ncbi:MAG: hypothetical protein ACFHVJ_09735 [Aestuariibacter sp.]
MKKLLLVVVAICLFAGNGAFAVGLSIPMDNMDMGNMDIVSDSQQQANETSEHDCCDDDKQESDSLPERCCDGSCDNCEQNCSGASAMLAMVISAGFSHADPPSDDVAQNTQKRLSKVDHPPIR